MIGYMAIFVLAAAAPGLAQPTGVTAYEVTSIGVLEGHRVSSAQELDEFARIVGLSGNAPHKTVLWVNGELFTPTVPPGGETGNFAGISPTSGLIVGSSLVNDRSRPAAWRIGGGSTMLPLLGGSIICYSATANDYGWIVGGCAAADRSALWPRLDAPIDLGSLGNQFGDEGANDINELGEIVGRSSNAQHITRPYLWRNGQMIDIGRDPANSVGFANGINNRSEVVGVQFAPFRWRDGVMTELPTFRSCFVTAKAINNLGLIVGEENMDDRCANGQEHAVAWEDVGQGYIEYDLNDFTPRHADVTLRQADDVNDAGQMAAFGEYDDGRERGFLVTPYLFEMSDPVPGIAGQPNIITVTGLQPDQRILLAYGTREGAQRIRPDCAGGTLLIRDPQASPIVRADQSGVATITVNVPQAARGRTIRMQALAPFECEISHTVTWTFE